MTFKVILYFFFILNLGNQNVTHFNGVISLQQSVEKDLVTENNILEYDQDIKEVKRNLLLLMFVIVLFASGLVLLIYYSKKIKIANKKLDFYSKENAFLLNEAHHRINNNLQIIISLISNELIKPNNMNNASLQKILSQIESISTLHRYLYKSEDKKMVDIKGYLEEIVLNFKDICIEENITTKIKIESQLIPNNTAMYLGLLVTELYINSIKYAFENQEDKIINLSVLSISNELKLRFSDNGKTLKDTVIEPQLVISLSKQLKASCNINTENGFLFELTKDCSINE